MKPQSSSSLRSTSHVHLFCPKCGGTSRVKTVMPLMSDPSIDEVVYSCDICGTETKVQIEKR
jgi:hypothetical protein